MKLVVYIFMLLLVVGYVSANDAAWWEAWRAGQTGQAGVSAKELLTISNCYNITITIKQTSGNTSTPSFKDCTDKGSGTWFCDCHNTVGEYPLMLQTDKANIDKARVYRINMNYTIYELSSAKNKFDVRDWGDSVDVQGQDITDLGKNEIIIEKPIYINQTVYQDRIIDRPVETIVYKDKLVNVYIENTTRVDELTNELSTAKQDISNWIIWTIFLAITTILLGGFIGYSYYKEVILRN